MNSIIFSNDANEESDKYDSRYMRRDHGYGCSFVVAASMQSWDKGAGPSDNRAYPTCVYVHVNTLFNPFHSDGLSHTY